MMRHHQRRTGIQRITAALIFAASSAFTLAAMAADPPVAAPAAAPVAPSAEKVTPIVHRNDRTTFDWSAWQHIPVFDDGRIKPLDTFADEVVTLVVGRSKWSPADAATPDELNSKSPPSKAVYKAPELLFAWITNQEAWVGERIIRCEYRPLRQILHDAAPDISVEGTFVALDDILDWKASRDKGVPVYRSAELEKRFQEIDRASASDTAPNQVGETAEDKQINGKVGELFSHIRAFLDVREARKVFVVPGLDPRVLTKQTNPHDRIPAWIPLGSLLRPEGWRTEADVSMVALMATDNMELLKALDVRNLVPLGPQLTQAQKIRDPLLAQIRTIRPATR